MVALIVQLVLGAVALALPALGHPEAQPLGVAAVLGLATLLAAGTPGAWLSAVAGVLLAVTTPGDVSATPLAVVAFIASAAAIGLTLRSLGPVFDDARAGGAHVYAILFLAVSALVMVLPDGWVQAYDGQGAPVVVSGVVKDATSGLRAPLTYSGYLPYPPSRTGLASLFPYLVGITAFLLMASTVASKRIAQAGWIGTVVAAAVLLFAGLGGIFEQLAGAAVPNLDPELLMIEINRAGGGRVAVDSLTAPPEAYLGLGSRPVVDALRAFCGLVLLAVAANPLRALMNTDEPGPVRGAQANIAHRGQPFVIVALMGAVVAAVVTSQGQQLVLVAMAVLLAAALVAGQFGHVSRRAPYAAAIGATVLGTYAWAAPVVGWVAAP